MNTELLKENALLRKRIEAWESELSKVMPPDFKDWWQNSKDEWPVVARCVIESLREREREAWNQLSLPVFVVIAYRYGMRDDHSYLVSVSTQIEEAKQAAQSEMEYRGGKYGCEVVECPVGAWNEDIEPKQVFYVPSPFEGNLGTGTHPVDVTNEGWKERLRESLKPKYQK